jgi:predicted lipoprotein with Yx(FWY)xxD motif
MKTSSSASNVLAGAAAVTLVALAAAGCGGDSGDAIAVTPSSTPSGDSATVDTADDGDLGEILTDSEGRTLYLFKRDSGGTSSCSGACARAWPPLRTSRAPTAGGGTTASLLGTTERSDGAPQVTYNGHPLYLYEGDQEAGDTAGQGLTTFGGPWYALGPAGTEISAEPSSAGGPY